VAALYFWMQVEFVAAVQIVVYVGGIVVLIIFSIFLTQQSGKLMPKTRPVQWVFSSLAVLLGFGWMVHLLWNYDFAQAPAGFFDVSVASIGARMLALTGDGYALPFEAVSVLLLAAMIGCIVIALKSPDSKGKDIATDKISEIS
jgi:NADH-quinone oxidoreductase subunit J